MLYILTSYCQRTTTCKCAYVGVKYSFYPVGNVWVGLQYHAYGIIYNLNKCCQNQTIEDCTSCS